MFRNASNWSSKTFLKNLVVALLCLQILNCTVELRRRDRSTIDEIDDIRLNEIASDLGLKMELTDRRWIGIEKIDLKGEYVFFQVKDSSSMDSIHVEQVDFFWYEHSSKGAAYGAAVGLLTGGTLSILSLQEKDNELNGSFFIIFTGCLTGITTFVGSLFTTEEFIQIENVQDSENPDNQ